MHPIVLATDFSPAAKQAAETAARLAQSWHRELILLNAYRFWPTNPAETGDFPLSSQAMHDNSLHALRELAHHLHEQISPDLPIRCLAREGYTRTVINDVTTAEQAELLVMATVGTAPQSARLMGSVATDMAAETRVPLLLLPPDTLFTTVENAALAISIDTPPDALSLNTALTLARRFGCMVHGLCVHDETDTPAVAHRIEQLRTLLEQQGHTLTVLPDTDTSGRLLYETLLYAEQARQADLLMMLPQPHSWLRNLFVEGETQRMARLTTLPLLAVV
ncbi:UspA domain protein [Fibrella aestuarina BUZ 2]|uniref:UspA domain protein n=1 Tax=Fibrella aestuarina BUZ 2 TaxID=1166018 RepID=I0K6M8_9BACT|nr:universal stress protein [Fibrella aestuarina]CCG99781.1 UspA domain protein [Fibrella aestuarina BUZ 2]